ncbi:hypothetical protein MC28_E132 (plasmid) [Bacillus thuringiensis MC28]|nr:hypothetical protein MC28_E132 [Bacillus thuringiensis MC28]
MIYEEISEKRGGEILIHQYEKLQSEVKRRLGKCSIKINTASLCVSEDSRYAIEKK